MLVLISTIGRVLGGRRMPRDPAGAAPRIGAGEVERLRESVEDLSIRLHRLEEERDFYKELLDAPGRPRAIRPPGDVQGASDPES